MSDIVFVSKKGNAITTSYLIANKFNKRHGDVLRAIDNMHCSDDFRQRNFAPVENQLVGSAKERYFLINRSGFAFLVMGFTGKNAAAFKEEYITAFDRMEERLKKPSIPENYAAALRLAADQQEEIELKNRIIEESKPKILFTDSVTSSSTTILIAELAKLISQNGYEIGQNRLFKWMRENGYLLSKGDYYNRPAQRYIEMGLFKLDEFVKTTGDKTITSITTRVTGKGQTYFINKFLSK